LTSIELPLSPKERLEVNLNKSINHETTADDEKLILLQSALRHVDKHKPYRKRPLKVNFNDQPPTAESSETLKVPKLE